jgi:hypothetical protein
MTCYFVILLSRRQAEAHDRRAYGVPPGVGLGWRPYTVRVITEGGISHAAFHNAHELRRWLGSARLVLTPYHTRGLRVGTVARA